jgi:hypothetical protein
MRVPIAIVIIGILIAIAILIAFRWEISAGPGFVYRLDRWTGNVIGCGVANPLGCRDVPFAQ